MARILEVGVYTTRARYQFASVPRSKARVNYCFTDRLSYRCAVDGGLLQMLYSGMPVRIVPPVLPKESVPVATRHWHHCAGGPTRQFPGSSTPNSYQSQPIQFLLPQAFAGYYPCRENQRDRSQKTMVLQLLSFLYCIFPNKESRR